MAGLPLPLLLPLSLNVTAGPPKRMSNVPPPPAQDGCVT